MVPFLDLFNFSNDRNVMWKYENRGGRNGYYVYAIKDIKRGEELFNSVNGMNNHALMKIYGYNDIENPNPIPVKINLSLPYPDPLFRLKKAVLGADDAQTGLIIFPTLDFSSDAVKDALSILRVVTFDDVENKQYIQNADIKLQQPRNNSYRPFDCRSEAKMMKEFKRLCEKKLEEYPRTLE